MPGGTISGFHGDVPKYSAHSSGHARCSKSFWADHAHYRAWCFLCSWNVHPAWCLNKTRQKHLQRQYLWSCPRLIKNNAVHCVVQLMPWRTLLGSSWKWLNCMPFPWVYNKMEQKCNVPTGIHDATIKVVAMWIVQLIYFNKHCLLRL